MPDETSTPSPDELLTIDEVAAILKVPPATIRKWRNEGAGPKGFRVGKYVRFRRTSIEEFIRRQEDTQ